MIDMTDASAVLDAIPTNYPAITKQIAGLIEGVPTEITSIQFADKIMVTITQGGRLAQWVERTLSRHLLHIWPSNVLSRSMSLWIPAIQPWQNNL